MPKTDRDEEYEERGECQPAIRPRILSHAASDAREAAQDPGKLCCAEKHDECSRNQGDE